jgi:hypothetical protein
MQTLANSPKKATNITLSSDVLSDLLQGLKPGSPYRYAGVIVFLSRVFPPILRRHLR